MDFNKKITENLLLQSVTENNWDDSKIIAVDCWFQFFKKSCQAIVVVEDLNSNNAKYAMIESDTAEIHSSLVEMLENEDVWNAIKDSIRKFIKEEWEPNNNE